MQEITESPFWQVFTAAHADIAAAIFSIIFLVAGLFCAKQVTELKMRCLFRESNIFLIITFCCYISGGYHACIALLGSTHEASHACGAPCSVEYSTESDLSESAQKVILEWLETELNEKNQNTK